MTPVHLRHFYDEESHRQSDIQNDKKMYQDFHGKHLELTILWIN